MSVFSVAVTGHFDARNYKSTIIPVILATLNTAILNPQTL